MQAARGASLNSSEADQTETQPTPSRHPRRGALLVFVTLAALGYAVDLVSKTLVVDKLSDRAPVHVVGDLLVLELARNPGAAFSTGTSHTVVFSVVAIVAACVVLWFARRLASTGWAIALGFLLAGILGNLTDRLFREPGPLRGHVVDFLRLPHWPIFNVADMCINVAAAVVVVQAIRGVTLTGVRAERSDRSPADRDEPGGDRSS